MWIYRELQHGSVGVKLFPRVGSKYFLESFGFGGSKKQFESADKRFYIVRNPWLRFLSVYYGMFKDPRKDYRMSERGYINPKDINELISFVLSLSDEDRDPHVRSMVGQLEGLEPASGEVYELGAFIEAPPVEMLGFRSPQWAEDDKPLPAPEEVEVGLDTKMFKRLVTEYKLDYKLFAMAEGAKYGQPTQTD